MGRVVHGKGVYKKDTHITIEHYGIRTRVTQVLMQVQDSGRWEYGHMCIKHKQHRR